jgi:ABC-2 type transport system permease protein
MWERLTHLMRKEFIQILRDRRMRAVLVALPAFQLFVFGYAATTEVVDITTAVADFDRTQETRELVRQFASSGYFRIVGAAASAEALRAVLDRGTAKVALQFDPGFANDLRQGRTAVVQVLVDGTASNTAVIALNYANQVIAQYNRQLVAPAAISVRAPGTTGGGGNASGPGPGAIDLRVRAWYNPELRSQAFTVPGIIALVIMLTSLQLTSMAIVREREIGTIEQLLVSPLRPAELILGKTLPFGLFAFAHVAFGTSVAVLWFGVPIKGSMLLLLAGTVLFLLSTLGVGVFISTVSKTQQEALMSTFLLFQPAFMLSGFLFPIANMPEPIQYVTYVNPLRYYLTIIRGIFLKANGFDILWPEFVMLLGLGLAILTVSTLRLRRRLE